MNEIVEKGRWAGYASDWPQGHRPCVECGRMLPFSMYHKHKACKFGVNSVCKECRKPKSKKSYAGRTTEEKLLDGAKQRAKTYNRDFNLEVSDIIIGNVCPVLKQPFGKSNTEMAPTLDRINNGYGYVKGNVRVISKKANRLKSNASIEDVEKVLDYMKNGCEVT